MTLSASVASMLLKKVSGCGFIEIFRKPKFWLGAFLYVLSAGVNIYLLTKLPYSVVVPLGSLTYVWTLLLSSRFLKEKINIKKSIGVFLILVGVMLTVSQL